MDTLTRRGFVTTVGAAALVAGFDPRAARWIATADAAACGPFSRAPRLDGTLHLEGAALDAASRDLGNIVTGRPCAVLRPGSAADVQRMVRFCARHGIDVAARGEGHATHGHALAPGGLVVEMRALRRIHALGPEGADVDAGVLWREVLEAGDAPKLTPRGVTGYTKLSVGGTLSVGGVGGQTSNEAMQMEGVEELEVVTGNGDLVRCSSRRHAELFESVLGGLGQFGIITRARLELVRAHERARVYTINHRDPATFFADYRTLLERGELDSVYCVGFPFGTNALYQLTAVAFYDAGVPPDDAHLMRGLSVPAALVSVRDDTYLRYLFFVDDLFDTYFAAVGYRDLVKPWLDVWLPDDTVEGYVADVVASLTPRDIGPTGFVLLLPQRRRGISRPFYRVPDVPGDEFIHLFDVLTSSAGPGPDPAFTAEMLARNRRLYDRAVAAGGTRYVIGSVDFTPQDWAAHYGETWMEFQRRKRRHDPQGILAPGLGIPRTA